VQKSIGWLAQEEPDIFSSAHCIPMIRTNPTRRTRESYQAMEFAYVLEEQFPADPNNPIAYYMKQIAP
jgi:hypothetical protein